MDDKGPRESTIKITWPQNGWIGYLSVGGEFWAAVEWSEKRQAWCIEDAEGRCLRHVRHIQGGEASKEAAVKLAEAMIRDGRMPDPATARLNLHAERKADREKRERQPAQIAKRERERRYSEATSKRYEMEFEEEQAPPFYEVMADAFDFTDADLWKSNSFATIRPRLLLNVRAAIAKLEGDLADEMKNRETQPFMLSASAETRRKAFEHRKAKSQKRIPKIEAKLARAREIESALAAGAAS